MEMGTITISPVSRKPGLILYPAEVALDWHIIIEQRLLGGRCLNFAFGDTKTFSDSQNKLLTRDEFFPQMANVRTSQTFLVFFHLDVFFF